MDLVVSLQRLEKRLNWAPERREALAEPREAAFDRLVTRSWLGHIPATIRASVADRVGREEASLAKPELDFVFDLRMKPGQASPGHLPAVFRRRVADRQRAHGRTDAVGADDEVVVAAPP